MYVESIKNERYMNMPIMVHRFLLDDESEIERFGNHQVREDTGLWFPAHVARRDTKRAIGITLCREDPMRVARLAVGARDRGIERSRPSAHKKAWECRRCAQEHRTRHDKRTKKKKKKVGR